MIALLVVGSACTTQAQDDKKKITIQITKEVDGETKTFKGEYSSEEEMRNDPAYLEFKGDDDDVNVWFDGSHGMDKIIQLHRGNGTNAFSFSFDDDNFFDFDKHFKHFRHGQGGPNAFFFGDDDAVIDLRGWNSEEDEEELAEKMEELEEKLKGLDKDLQKEIMESMKEMQEMHSFPKRINRTGISIEEVGDDFGKKGKVAESEKLDLDDFKFMVMRNRLNVRFMMKEEAELSVKISNEDGRDIYNRYFEKFGGHFSDDIDFSQYSEGKYLLEIQQGKKRLTRKIVID